MGNGRGGGRGGGGGGAGQVSDRSWRDIDYYLYIEFFFFCGVTVVLSTVISSSLLLIPYMICSLSSLSSWSVDVDML